ncbi:cell division protein [Salinigranum rubrum]|uniref:Tubulin-like protein CetZ n=1 Tax=Salinigranum rubrum TaxID=755307 RepID=A0A2I8VHP7_9EURY|nr:tubulin/FtsZ family protein [Salinigranum rubrum]AUV81457.1 cell division protein [Salinigranum rubrum]
MKLALIGIGQAGGKVVDALLRYDRSARSSFVTAALAVNTARADLAGLELIPPDKRVLVGQARVKGHGVGADNELGAEVMAEDVDEVLAALDDVSSTEVDAFLVVAGLGGGTGSGGAPVLAHELKRLYTEPVYGIGILPGRDEGGIYTLNAARSFQTFVREVDNLIVFDNDAWRHTGESVKQGYASLNEELARRLGVLFSAGEVTDGQVAESVVDSSEIINTLASGGVSTVGYASARLERRGGGFLSRFRSSSSDVDDGGAMNRVSSLIRRATLGRLTLPCDVSGTERALVVVSGPPETLSRRGIERGRTWLEEETGTMEIRGGDAPVDSDFVAVVVLLSGVTSVPRIKELQAVAIEAQREGQERDATSADNLASLLDTDDELDALF